MWPGLEERMAFSDPGWEIQMLTFSAPIRRGSVTSWLGLQKGKLLIDSDPGNWESQQGQKQASLDITDFGEPSFRIVHMENGVLG